jgi:hypothetical protein
MGQSHSESLISRNKICYNAIPDSIIGKGGGIIISVYGLPVTNNIISKNTAVHGGGIYLYSGTGACSPEIINNTIVSNTSFSSGGGLCLDAQSNPIIVNNIFWTNDAPSAPQISGNVNAYYSNIQGGWTVGLNNIDSDPLFEDTLQYHLQNSSPCIGTGIDSIQIGGVWYSCPTCDCEGGVRPDPPGTMPDIGAWESPYDPVGIEQKELDQVITDFQLYQNYPNPFNPSTTIEFDLPMTSEVTLKVFNILGEEVATLLSASLLSGSYKYEWDASNLASGIYLYRFQAGDYVETKKMMLMR